MSFSISMLAPRKERRPEMVEEVRGMEVYEWWSEEVEVLEEEVVVGVEREERRGKERREVEWMTVGRLC